MPGRACANDDGEGAVWYYEAGRSAVDVFGRVRVNRDITTVGLHQEDEARTYRSGGCEAQSQGRGTVNYLATVAGNNGVCAGLRYVAVCREVPSNDGIGNVRHNLTQAVIHVGCWSRTLNINAADIGV